MVQMNCIAGEPDRNLDAVARNAREAVVEGASFVCFPELSISGYVADSSSSEFAESIPGPSSERLIDIARDTDATLLAGLLELGIDGRIYNTHVVVSRSGLIGAYRKTHVAPSEAEGFAPGVELDVFDGPSLSFGLEICFDAHFPEASSSLARQGAEIIFIPHASVGETHESKLERWMRYLPARAYDNSVYVAVCNQTGPNGRGDDFPGVTLVLDPLGRVIAQSTGPSPQIVYADLDPDELENAHSDENLYFVPLRQPDLYGEPHADATQPSMADATEQ
jgi:predicted amidohydrolase